MSLTWETYKSALGGYWNTSCIMYVDEEGSEIPIESECELKEALRIAKLNKNRLKLILYEKQTPSSQKMQMTFPESLRVFVSVENTDKSPESTMSCNSKGKENTCSDDVPPPWFTHYMKKFKKDLLQEIKTNILEAKESAAVKEQKSSFKKLDGANFFGEKNKILFSPFNTQTKKKKKVSDKDGMEPLEKWDPKPLKKSEKLHSSKFERLEKLDNKTKLWMEEKKKLWEKKRHSKLQKNGLVPLEKECQPKKSATFFEEDVYISLDPGEKFSVTLRIKNDGKDCLYSPQLECFDLNKLSLDNTCIDLPNLSPNTSCFVKLKGTASKVRGRQNFKCRVVEMGEQISADLTCWGEVDSFELHEKFPNVPLSRKNSYDSAVQSGDSIEKLIDLDKEFITKSEKKIEENIREIEKRLRNIELMEPSISKNAYLKKAHGKTKKVLTKNPKPKTKACDLLRDLEEMEKSLTKRLEQEKIIFGVDCLRLASGHDADSEVSTNQKTEENQQSGKSSFDKIERDCELESNSDSELSVLFMSEEEENFIVVPLPHKSPSPAESVHEDEKSVNLDSENKPVESQEEPEPNVVKEQHLKSEITSTVHMQVDKETSTPENLSPDQLSPTRSRRSPFREEIPKFKPKKMKSKSTEYHFTTANLTQTSFPSTSDGLCNDRPSKFTFTGEKKEKNAENGVNFKFTAEKEEKNQKDDLRGRTVPKTDASGKVIYAVNNMGRCLLVDDLFEKGENSTNAREENSGTDGQKSQNRNGKRGECFNEIPAVNILPNVLMNGASNVASMAFNTAKSVINNLHSAFVTEGKTEVGKPACEDKKKVSMENLLRLYEMGFSDLEINRELLLMHDNDVSRVVDELFSSVDNLMNP